MENNTIIIKLYMDGNQWCALVGEDLQVGIAAFGSTKLEALSKLAMILEEPNGKS